ncbi:MAG: YbhN family protein, partial [Nitriliruptorales bacterium]
KAGHGLLRRAAMLFTVFLGVAAVAPQLSGLRATAQALARAQWWLPPAVIGFTLAAVAVQAELLRVVLKVGGEQPRHALLLRLAFARNALSRILPAGGATGLAVTVAILARHGVDAARATSALAATGVVSFGVLVVILPLAALPALGGGSVGREVVAGGAAALLIGAAAVGALAVVRRPRFVASLAARLAGLFARGPLRRWLDPNRVEATALRGVTVVSVLGNNRAALSAAAGWAAMSWLLDLGALLVVSATIGQGTPLRFLPLAFVAAQLAATVPITPGGVGVVEATMIGVLVGGGGTAAAATAATLGWRLISHWLPVVVGLAALPTLGARPLRQLALPSPQGEGEADFREQ